ncbi:MAG: hypothetical protein K2Q01_09315, partial [Rickettsiales bacterium]|nr:hypothetical protein [Rickettsiales bacterium]
MELQRFTIANCTPEQQELFTALNGVLKDLRISADEFDRGFRVHMMQQCYLLGESAKTELAKAVYTPISLPIPDRYNMKRAATGNTFLGTGALKVQLARPVLNELSANALARDVDEAELHMTSAITGVVSAFLGRFQDIDPASLTPEQRKTY